MNGFGYSHEDDRCLRVTWRGGELLRYVYRPWDAQVESPRPYFHPLRTIGRDLVSLYRPHDHVWHKGIAFGLSNVVTKDGTENFWGGPTYLRGRGYVQLDNDGTISHDRFDSLSLRDGALHVDEHLTWRTQKGTDVFAEHRRFAVTVLPDEPAWQLALRTTVRNISADPVLIGSPTTQGRENAGYSGLFWRGPRAFNGGQVIMPDAPGAEGNAGTGGSVGGTVGGVVGGDELMGRRAAWLAFVGRHDGHGRASSLLFRDDPANSDHPVQWFVRSGVYACVCPAPFFSTEYPLEPGADLTLRYDVVVADGELDLEGGSRLAARAAKLDLGGLS